MKRCKWVNNNEKMISYHDTEWGFPCHEDRKLFEYLFLESMQCGLSWELIINKRDIFADCFDNFDCLRISEYDEEDIKRILSHPGMIRSERKIRAMINNAKCFIKAAEVHGSFDRYIWSYTSGKTLIYPHHLDGSVPSSNNLSALISRDLKKKGFSFVGPVVIYSYLQACGIINDHEEKCFCHSMIIENHPCIFETRDI